MGASNTGLKSYRSNRVEDRNNHTNIPRMNVEDLENYNSRIFINPQENSNDLNNNRTATLINHNIYSASLQLKSATTLLTSYNECDKSPQCQLSRETMELKQEKVAEGSSKKSSKKRCEKKVATNEKNKNKKQESKPPRALAACNRAGGKRRMAEQDQVRRPRKKINTKTEK